MIERLAKGHVVLLGIGHTNAHVLRMWRMHAPDDADLTCVSNHPIATYSGMLPAVLAGQIPAAQMEIDLVRLCASVGARLILDPVSGIDQQRRELSFVDRPPIPFDVLSVGVGSTAGIEGVTVSGESFVMIKPMQTFLQRLQDALDRAADGSEKLNVVVVGGGVAGIEITCCLPNYLDQHAGLPYSLCLLNRGSQILPELETKTSGMVRAELESRGVAVTVDATVVKVESDTVELSDGRRLDANVVIWATGATPPPLLGQLGLPLDQRGFLATDHTLQSTGAAGIFAVGDTGTIADTSLPKAGVYAVRQGPVLWENINRTLAGKSLQRYQPQTSFLKLINLGNGHAVGQWKGRSFQGRWVMRLKSWIDERFMEKFQVKPMAESGSEDDDEMQCRGCGCKLGARSLESALQADGSVVLEDAAEIGTDDARLLASTDFFSSPVTDAFLAGRIAALHSASDIIATGAAVTQALANVVLPEGDAETQRRMLQDFLSGARREFDALGSQVVGGHTIVGPRFEVGFTVIGKPLGPKLIRKCNLKPGDQLYLTKPVGIGILLAAHMRSECGGREWIQLIDAMLYRQHDFAKVAVDCGIDAGTDITGFGLAGHLIEMLGESKVGAEIQLNQIPLLPGARKAAEEGIQSTLVPENRKAQAKMSSDSSVRDRAAYDLLFDPQTCGGLLLGVREQAVDPFLAGAAKQGLPAPVCIGQVESGAAELRVVL